MSKQEIKFNPINEKYIIIDYININSLLLSQHLLFTTKLKNLQLSCPTYEDNLSIIFYQLLQNYSITNLKLINCLSPKNLNDLSFIINMNQLNCLSISHNNLFYDSENNYNFIKNFIQSLSNNYSLKKLSLINVNMSAKNMRYISEILIINSNLQTLYLGEKPSIHENFHLGFKNSRFFNDISDEGMIYLSEALIINSSLKKLDIYTNKIDKNYIKNIVYIIEGNKSLKNLSANFANNNLKEIKLIINALIKNNTLKKLTKIYESNINDSEIAILYSNLLSSNTSLSKLVIDLIHFKYDLYDIVIQGLCKNVIIKRLSFSSNTKTKDIATILKNNINLKEINIISIISNIDLTLLSNVMKENKTLESISLRGKFDNFSIILNALINHKYIKDLEIGGSIITLEHFKLISELLKKNKSLTILRLNAASDYIDIIIENLKYNDTISSLKFMNTPLTDNQYENLISTIAKSTSIHNIVISRNQKYYKQLSYLFLINRNWDYCLNKSKLDLIIKKRLFLESNNINDLLLLKNFEEKYEEKINENDFFWLYWILNHLFPKDLILYHIFESSFHVYNKKNGFVKWKYLSLLKKSK
jgi:hypothetical protein